MNRKGFHGTVEGTPDDSKFSRVVGSRRTFLSTILPKTHRQRIRFTLEDQGPFQTVEELDLYLSFAPRVKVLRKRLASVTRLDDSLLSN